MATFLASVAAKQVGRPRVVDAIGKLVVENLAGNLETVQETQGIDVELLHRFQRGNGRIEIGVLLHAFVFRRNGAQVKSRHQSGVKNFPIQNSAASAPLREPSGNMLAR